MISGASRRSKESKETIHGRAEEKDVAIAARHAAFRRRAEATDLYGRQGFGRVAPSPSHRPQDRHVSRPPGSQAEIRGVTAHPIAAGAAAPHRRKSAGVHWG